MTDTIDHADLEARSADVDQLVATLASNRRPHATREDAWLSWNRHSDSSCASWLIVGSADEVVAAYDMLVLDRIDTAIRAAVDHRRDEVADFVADYLGQTSTDPEDPDLITFSAIMPRGQDDRVLGVARQWSSDDQGLVEALCDRFDVELPAGRDAYARSHVLVAFGLAAVDASGFSA